MPSKKKTKKDGRVNNRPGKRFIAPRGNKFAEGNTGGRPTKFKPAFIKQIIDHFSVEAYRKELMEKSEEYFAVKKGSAPKGTLKKKSFKYKFMPNKLPTIYGFARKIGVDYTTVYRWAMEGKDDKIPEAVLNAMTEKERNDMDLTNKQIREFCKSFKEAKELQKEFLISLGLAGITPSGSYVFTAKNLTDMKDKSEVVVRRPKPILDIEDVHKDDSDEEDTIVI